MSTKTSLPTLQEAQEKYPIGTIFNNKNLNYGCSNIEISGSEFYYSEGEIMVSRYSVSGGISNYTIYRKGVWADIDFSPNLESNYEIY